MQEVWQEIGLNKAVSNAASKSNTKHPKDIIEQGDDDEEDESSDERSLSRAENDKNTTAPVSYADLSDELQSCLPSKTHAWVQSQPGKILCFDSGRNNIAEAHAKAWYKYIKHLDLQNEMARCDDAGLKKIFIGVSFAVRKLHPTVYPPATRGARQKWMQSVADERNSTPIPEDSWRTKRGRVLVEPNSFASDEDQGEEEDESPRRPAAR
ncbi:hypothetical protein SBOR_4051 [Sclerotinia borealis F-4128]|uniref:Uncharacterized protein n=1 Tax=Sclerotinia borealis (strain F-4128) TaxID=1432307 RepID=W9CI68_SCLBF|nr:hypothetical protein SBOR_4051 [Sclerotinia borealis F-4128]